MPQNASFDGFFYDKLYSKLEYSGCFLLNSCYRSAFFVSKEESELWTCVIQVVLAFRPKR